MKEGFWTAVISVGCGGFIGSVLRYCLSLVTVKWDFPLMTFLTNLLGAVLIGIAAEAATRYANLPGGLLLFLKTGVCGGFTTFSTFSLETAGLLEHHRYKTAFCYLFLSLICCIAGVELGKKIIHVIH